MQYEFDKYDPDNLKPSKARAALIKLHNYYTLNEFANPAKRAEFEAVFLRLNGVEIYQAFKSFLDNCGKCQICDGAGFICIPEGVDSYDTEDCPACKGLSESVAKPLTEQQQAYIKMHMTLGGIINGSGFEDLDPVSQDEITAAHKAGEKWI